MADSRFEVSQFAMDAPNAIHGVLSIIAELNHPDRTPDEIATVYLDAVRRGIEVGQTMVFASELSGPEEVSPVLHREFNALAILSGIALSAADRKEPNVVPPPSEMLKMQAEAAHGNDWAQYAPEPMYKLEF